MKQLRWAAFAAMLTLGTAAAVAPAQAQVAGDRAGATGGTVIQVSYDGGLFRMGPGGWEEFDSSARIAARFRETGRDDWSVYLHEIGTDKQVQLDLYRMRILVSQGGAPMSDLYVITSARAPRAVSPPVRSDTPYAFTVKRVNYRDGYFQAIGEGRWTEYRNDGSVAFRFIMRSIGNDVISLFDDSRNTGVDLDLNRRMIQISFNGARFEDLYPITAVTPARTGGAAIVPPPQQLRPVYVPPAAVATVSYDSQTLFKIEAGPITSQAEANAKCPALATRAHGIWTQGWERRDGVNSVCVLGFGR
jgi:hypothetical protein